MEGCLGWEGRRRRVERRGSGKKGWERARGENELQKKEKMVSASDGGWHHSAESDLGGGGEGHIIRWSEVSALEDDDDLKERCLHSSRKLCSRLREEWGKWWIIIICARCYQELCRLAFRLFCSLGAFWKAL